MAGDVYCGNWTQDVVSLYINKQQFKAPITGVTLFIFYGLFSETVSSDYIMSNDRVISEEWIAEEGKEVVMA
jgi:hypothetical protein